MTFEILELFLLLYTKLNYFTNGARTHLCELLGSYNYKDV